MNWEKEFSNTSLDKSDTILKETNKNYLIGSPKLNAQGILTFKNITPGDKSITITGYQIISSSEDGNFNSTIDLNETTIQPGATQVISISAFPPEQKVTILLITDENEYISVGQIQNISEDLRDIPAEELEQVATPTSIPVYTAICPGDLISLSCATSGALIYYTTNGTDPTQSSTLYTTPIIASNLPFTLKVRAYKINYADSNILTVLYTINQMIC